MKRTVIITLLLLALNFISVQAVAIENADRNSVTSTVTIIENIKNVIDKNFKVRNKTEEVGKEDEIIPEAMVTEIYTSRTIEIMKNHGYYNESITGITNKKVDEEALNRELSQYGRLIYKGMPTEEYRQAMENQWIDETDYINKPENINIDLNKVIDYNTYVDILKKLSRYEGVFLYKIGKSTDGRDLYCIEIDVQSDSNKNVFMFSGQHHSREFAGGIYILKQFTDLIQKAQWDAGTMELLKNNKYVAVPIVSLDVREGIIQNRYAWTMTDGQLWKAYNNGVDGNRNYPGLQWGLVAKGNNIKSTMELNPSYANYAGSYGGSSNETKAMMKWFYHYIVVEKAVYYLDYHQQGRVIYAGEPWQYQRQFDKQLKFVDDINSVIKTNGGATYNYMWEEKQYGLQGEGSSATDYAISLAVGAKFSPEYGFHVFNNWGKEYTLMEIGDLDNGWISPMETNPNFAAVTLEIGAGQNYLGYSEETRRLISSEYFNYNHDKLLEKLPTFIK